MISNLQETEREIRAEQILGFANDKDNEKEKEKEEIKKEEARGQRTNVR